MTPAAEHVPRVPPVRALLLDVEGTTTPVSFVYDVLFPYARSHLRAYVAAHLGDGELVEAATMLVSEWSADSRAREPVPTPAPSPTNADALCEYLNWLMDRDRKSPGLKLVQGMIWEQGYRDGELRSQVFADVRRAFARWRVRGVTIAIYSSGSVLAQRLLFAHSDSGDLTAAISHYFDTEVGAKRSVDSYARIAEALHLSPADIAFVSDVDAELEAARDAGCRVIMSVRPKNAATASRVAQVVHSFDEIDALLGLASESS